MGRVSYQDAISNMPQNDYGDKVYYNFFNLKDDKDSAIVRFMHDSVDDFDIVQVHGGIDIGKGYRDVSCLRSYTDPISKCPFCAAGMKATTRFIVHMLQYTLDDTGKIVCEPVVWNRSYQYIEKMKAYIDNYGPMSDVLCKVIRNGKRGDMQTTYEIVPNLNPAQYPSDVYVKDTAAFENYNSIGTAVWEKSEADMQYYITHDNHFPQSNNQQQVQPASVISYQQNVAQSQVQQPVYEQAPVNNVVTPTGGREVPPWERVQSAPQQQVSRPQRNY